MGKKRAFNLDSDFEEMISSGNALSSSDTSSTAELINSSKKFKPLPSGYVCKICGMEDHHAVYACPHKIKKYSNQEKSSTELCISETSKSVQTVFISGLPYDLNREALIKYLSDEGCMLNLTKKDIKLVMFEDNPKKCKGLAFIKLHDDEVTKALALNGKKFGVLNLSVELVDGNRPKSTKKSHKNVTNNEKNVKRCYRCGMLHDPSICSNPRICYRCKSTEHLSSVCPLKKLQ